MLAKEKKAKEKRAAKVSISQSPHSASLFAHTRTRRDGYLCPDCLSIHRDILVPEGTITLTVCPYIAMYETDTFLLIPEENRRQRDAR